MGKLWRNCNSALFWAYKLIHVGLERRVG